MQKKLRRSSTDTVIAGVCGGIGEYFDVDPVIVRVAWVVLSFIPNAPGIIAYIICAIILPVDRGVIYHDDDGNESSGTNNTPLFIGIVLIAIGVIMLLDIIFPNFFDIFDLFKYWPVLLILAGIYIIIKQKDNR